MPQLQKAKSLIDDDVSEVLLGQAFEIMFKEFERYIGIMLGFDGIDWSTYVRKRNQDRYEKGDALDELKNVDNILLDEIEEEKEDENEEEKPAEAETKPAEEEKPAEESTQIEEKPAEELTPEQEEEKRRQEEEEKRKKEEEEQKKKEEEQ